MNCIGQTKRGYTVDCLRMGWNWSELRDRLTILVIVGSRTVFLQFSSCYNVDRNAYTQYRRVISLFDYWLPCPSIPLVGAEANPHRFPLPPVFLSPLSLHMSSSIRSPLCPSLWLPVWDLGVCKLPSRSGRIWPPNAFWYILVTNCRIWGSVSFECCS